MIARRDMVSGRRLRLRHLLLLRELGETGTLSEAADRIGMAQPAATRLLSGLEASMGLLLFDRGPKGMTATPYGAIMIRHARRALAELARAEEEVASLAAGSAGRLRLGAVTSAAPILLPLAVAEVRRRSPNLALELVEGGNDLLMGALADGQIDALIARTLPPHLAGRVRCEPLFMEQHRVVCGSGHPLSTRRGLALADLVDADWVLPPAILPFRRELDLLFLREAGRVPGRVVESVSILSNQALFEDSGLIGILPASAALRQAPEGRIVILDVATTLPVAPVALFTEAVSPRLPAVELAAAVLSDLAARLSRDQDDASARPLRNERRRR